MWLDNFDVISTEFQLFLKLHSHISVSWRFCRISMISKISSLDIGLKTKTQKSRKICIFWIYKVQIHVDLLFDHYFNILSLKTGINKQTKQKKNSRNKKTKKNKKKTQTQFNKSRGVRIS